jgi:perosamine synthetase
VIPVCEPDIGTREHQLVEECLRSGWISSAGRYLDMFESRWAQFCAMPHGVAMSSGTAALAAAAAALDLGPGDEVILPTFTIVSCATAVVDRGAVPVLVDADPRTFTMNVQQVAARLGPRTRAIMPVHIYGHPVDMDPLIELAGRHGLSIIEDAAEAHGAEYRGRRCGGLGNLGCFSFYANKLITTGEGGMVLARDPTLAARLRSERNLAFGPGRRFQHEEIGHNYRLTNLQAAIGCAQLDNVEERIERKRRIAQGYNQRLASVPQLQLPVEEPWARNVYWVYGVVLRDDVPMDAAELARRLCRLGVETRPFFLGMHEQPVFRRRGLFLQDRHPVAERIARRGLYLPSGLTLTDSQVDVVCAAVIRALL